jgi:hypothetical protein
MMASNETLAAEVASRQLEVRELRREVSKLASVQDQLRTAEAKSQSLVDLLSEKEDVVRSAGESGSGAACNMEHTTCNTQRATWNMQGRAVPALHRCATVIQLVGPGLCRRTHAPTSPSMHVCTSVGAGSSAQCIASHSFLVCFRSE